jgi:protein TonB
MEETLSHDTDLRFVTGTGPDGRQPRDGNALALPLALSLALHVALGLVLLAETFRTLPPRLREAGLSPLQVVWVTASKTAMPAPQRAPGVKRAPDAAPVSAEAAAPAPPSAALAGLAAIPALSKAPPRPTETAAAPPASAHPGTGKTVPPATPPSSGVRGAADGETPALTLPRYRANNAPAYPALARLRGYEGLVLLAAQVSEQGRVQTIRVKKSSGYAVLDRSAEEAVRSWRFEPGRRMGTPMAMWVDVPVRFVLEESPAFSDS